MAIASYTYIEGVPQILVDKYLECKKIAGNKFDYEAHGFSDTALAIRLLHHHVSYDTRSKLIR